MAWLVFSYEQAVSVRSFSWRASCRRRRHSAKPCRFISYQKTIPPTKGWKHHPRPIPFALRLFIRTSRSIATAASQSSYKAARIHLQCSVSREDSLRPNVSMMVSACESSHRAPALRQTPVERARSTGHPSRVGNRGTTEDSSHDQPVKRPSLQLSHYGIDQALLRYSPLRRTHAQTIVFWRANSRHESRIRESRNPRGRHLGAHIVRPAMSPSQPVDSNRHLTPPIVAGATTGFRPLRTLSPESRPG